LNFIRRYIISRNSDFEKDDPSSKIVIKKSSSFLGLFFLLIIISLLLTSCVSLYDPEASQEWNAKVVGVLNPWNRIGQSFVSRRSRLNHIQLWVRETNSGSTPAAILWAHLYHSKNDLEPIQTISIPYARVTNAFPFDIPINLKDNQAEQNYYLEFETNGGELQFYGRPDDGYSDGEIFLDGVPGEADIAFRLSYVYDLRALIKDFWLVINNLWLIMPLFLVLFIPGYLLLELIKQKKSDWEFDKGEEIALAIGLSISVIPVVLLWTSWLRIPLTYSFVIIILSFLSLIFIWRVWRNQKNSSLRILSVERDIEPVSMSTSFVFYLLIAVFLLSLGVRLIMVRDLATPAWVDPLHHATITRLIMERGVYPSDYQPYLDIDRAGYHAGYHAALAVFLWLSGMPLDEGMLIYGQFLNALIVFSVYLFTTTLTNNKKAGLIAALISGVVTPMPAYYTSWGRYTQLAGLIILPTALALIIKLWHLEGVKRKIPWIVIAVIASAGLFLVHYRVIAFLALLLASIWLGLSLQALVKKDYLKKNFRLLISIISIVILAVLLVSPQIPNIIESEIIESVSPGKSNTSAFVDLNWNYLTTAYGRQALFLAGLGLLLSLLQARWFGPILALWVSLLFLLSNPMRLNLPGVGLVNNTSVLIALFLPIATMGGYFLATFIEEISYLVKSKYRFAYWSLIIVVALGLSIKAAQVLLPILNPVTLLSRQADMDAIDWLSANIPQEERILISPFLWGYGLYAGQDGGYWITPLSGHRTFPPPVLYGLDDRDVILETNRLCKEVIEIGEQPNKLYSFMDEQDLDYLFLGVRGQVYSFRNLSISPLFKLLYHKDGVSIFQRESNTSAE